MGINARGYFVVDHEVSDTDIKRIEEDFKFTFGQIDPDISRYSFSSLRNGKEFNGACVEINFDLDRLYFKGYERGNALAHIKVLGWLRRRSYVQGVYYGGDCGELIDCGEWDEKTEMEIIHLFLNSANLLYRSDQHMQRSWFK